jgi:ubiquinol-cytochrome c reductase iron-sulfur subunit
MPDEAPADQRRRRFLVAATSTLGGIGVAGVGAALVRSLEPDASVEAASVQTVDISRIEPGMQVTVSWQGKPVLVLNRSPEMLATLTQVTPRLLDPDSEVPQQPPYCRNIYRARQPEWLVMVFVCTHLCCVPLLKEKKGSVDAAWLGGFHCPCHGSFYDLSGRVFKDVPAPRNMAIPEYDFVDNGSKIRITAMAKGARLC